MKWISIYMTLLILFSINFRSVCVGGDKDKQNTGHNTAQGYCNEEKKVQKQKEDTEEMQEPKRGTRNLDIKHSVMPREQISTENSFMKKHNYGSDYYWMIDRYDSLYERDYFYNYYFCDKGDLDESLERCSCCTIL